MISKEKTLILDAKGFTAWLAKTPFVRKIDHLQVHHTWSPSYKDFNKTNHISLLIGMENYQMAPVPKGDGMSQIAQNFTTFPDLTIAVCRDINIQPAGIRGANFDGICIENLGCFDTGGDIMTPAQKDFIVFVYASLLKKCNLAPNVDSLKYHVWYNLNSAIEDDDDATKEYLPDHKTCPGTNWFGGNTVKACEQFFIPLIVEKMKTL